MRDVTRQKLERTIRLQRLRSVLMGVAAVIAVAGFMALMFSRQPSGPDVLTEEKTVSGAVKFWYQAPVRQAQGQDVISVTVTLDDGRDVQAGSSAHRSAQKGDRVELTERHYKSGRVTYVWK